MPAGYRLQPDPAERELRVLYATDAERRREPGGAAAEPARSDRPWVRASMIATLDGAATGPDGRSGTINGPADLRVFTVLRSLADAVLVGAGTVRAEGYTPLRTPEPLHAVRLAEGRPAHPTLVVVSGSGDVPAVVLHGEPAPWVCTLTTAPGLPALRRVVSPERLIVHEGGVDLADVLRRLGAAGLHDVLTEGGPALLADLVGAGLVDELCLTTSPVLVGGPAGRVLAGPWLEPSAMAAPAHLLHADGVLLGRWHLPRR